MVGKAGSLVRLDDDVVGARLGCRDREPWVLRAAHVVHDGRARSEGGLGVLGLGGEEDDVAVLEGNLGGVVDGGDAGGERFVGGADGEAEFVVAFSDNRYNIWPWQTEFGGIVPAGEEWRFYPVFQAPDDPETADPGVSCVNYGSRVQSVMAARVSTSGLLLSAPTNRKPFDGALPVCGGTDPGTDCIEFPLSVRNNTGTERTVSLSVPSGGASFAKRPFDEALDVGEPYDYPLVTGEVTIYPYSSYALNVYAFDGQPVTVAAAADGVWITDGAGLMRRLGEAAVAPFGRYL